MNSDVKPPYRAEGRYLYVLNAEGEYVHCGSLESENLALQAAQALMAFDTDAWDDAATLPMRVNQLLVSNVLPTLDRLELAKVAEKYTDAWYDLSVLLATKLLLARGLLARSLAPIEMELPDGNATG